MERSRAPTPSLKAISGTTHEGEKQVPLQRLKPGSFLDADRMTALLDLVPEAFGDGSINWTTLKDALAGALEEEEKDSEHFGLFWPGKREARRLASRPSSGTLVPCRGEGIDEDTTGNIFIEGENLEVLKLLRKSYAGQVKMIYIDPPYNTGNDFVYDDDFTEPLVDYLKRTGQIDGEGRPFTTNKKSDGRFHSKWLTMMYPRLRLARELLKDDGVIFVSIDDNEVHHLRMLMNEVFGEECFIGSFTWKCRKFADARSVSGISVDHEYLLCFGNNDSRLSGIARDEGKFSNPDNDPHGPWMSRSMLGLATASQRPNLHYPIIEPKTGRVFDPPSNTGWRYSKERMMQLIADSCVLFPSKDDGRPREKKHRADLLREKIAFPSIITGVHTSDGTEEIRGLFGSEIFDFSKPTALIKRLIQQGADEASIILDFFSGSATTAHAVLDLNKEDGGARKFVLVQMPEAVPVDSEASKAGYATIAEIGKERIRRVIAKIKADKTPELHAGESAPDLGFKVFKLAKSNFKPWEDYKGEDVGKLEALFADSVTPLVPTWKEIEDGLFTEVLLLEGYPLDSSVKVRSDFTKNRIREVSCSFHEKRLLVCLDELIASETVAALTLAPNEVFVCLDAAVDDGTKSTLDDKGLIRTI